MFSLALLSAASALSIVVDSGDFKGQYVSDLHFGAGLNGVLLGSQPANYELNATSNTLYHNVTINGGDLTLPMTFTDLGHDLITQMGPDGSVVVDNGKLTINGSDSLFYACQPLAWDPYGYTTKEGTYGVGVYDEAPAGCSPITLATTD